LAALADLIAPATVLPADIAPEINNGHLIFLFLAKVARYFQTEAVIISFFSLKHYFN
jgi:hypothetical protein